MHFHKMCFTQYKIYKKDPSENIVPIMSILSLTEAKSIHKEAVLAIKKHWQHGL